MQEAGDSNLNVRMDIQSELMSINTLVTKMRLWGRRLLARISLAIFSKQELLEINGIVKTDGSLDTALENTIRSLVLLAEETGTVLPDPVVVEGEENPMAAGLSRITAGYITEKLKALSHE